MSSLEKLNFVNHRNKCRCCFRAFDGEDDFQIKVSETVQNRFLELTQLKLEVSGSYSSVVCERCYKELRSFSVFRQELINKQLLFHKFEKKLSLAELHRDSSDLNATEKEALTLTEHDDSSDCVEVKMETEAFNDGLIQNDHSSTCLRAQAEARSSKILGIRKSKVIGRKSDSILHKSFLAHGSNKDKAKMSQHELVDKFEDQPVQKIKGPVPLRRIKPVKRQDFGLRWKSETPGKKIVCSACGKTFVTNQTLKLHQKAIHSKIKRYGCDICGYKCHQKCRLRKHIRIHSADYDSVRAFPCNVEGCGKYFKTKAALQQHSVCHSDERPYRCHCGQAFKRAFVLNRHQMIKRCSN